MLNFDIFDPAPHSAEIARWKGENAREILLFYEQTDETGVQAFLERVLQAARVDLAKDTLFAEIANQSVPSFALLYRRAAFQTLLVFGFTPADLGLQINWSYYVPIRFRGKTLLFCDSLQVLMEERARGGSERSGPFWKALQQIFLHQ